MTDTLRKYFPDIRSRNEVMADIQQKKELLHQFQSWTKEQQDEFLDFCCGARGVKILYDSFFKEIMNPENTPERLNGLLSLLLGRSVKILHVLPNDSSRIADESSLLVMDILVELEDKSLANVEVQKIGYAFPGPRCACYSADLLLRQYKRIRGEKAKSSVTGTSNPCIPLFFMKRAFLNSAATQTPTSTSLNKAPTLDCIWNCCKNTCSYPLTSSARICTI